MRSAIDQFFQLFNNHIPDESSAREFIATWIAQSGLRCRTCGNDNLYRSDSLRTRVCVTCKRPTWVTADSYFRKSKSVRTHLCAILITQAGVEISDAELARRLKVAQSTVWCAMRKVGLIIARTFTDVVNVLSSNFQALVRKRSGLTPVGAKPEAEELAMNATQSSDDFNIYEYMAEKQQGEVTGLENFVRVYEHLSDKPKHFDVLCTELDADPSNLTVDLVNLQFMGLVENVHACFWRRKASVVGLIQSARSTGGGEEAIKEGIESLMENIWSKITNAHGGVSRKYLQLHISAGVFRDAATLPRHSLLDSCLAVGHISMLEIQEFVSPPMLSIPKCLPNWLTPITE